PSWVRANEVINARARGRLPAFDQPKARDHRRKIRAPDAGNEAGLRGGGHDACRGPHDIGEAIRKLALFAMRAAADTADGAGVGVDQGGADRRPGKQAEFGSRLRCKTTGERGSWCDDLAADLPLAVG